MTTSRIGLLGAEKQAAVSAALAWPERQFIFVTEQDVIDGWDLPNVEHLRGSPAALPDVTNVAWVPLCGRWSSAAHGALPGTWSTHAALSALHAKFGDVVLPLLRERPAKGTCIVKGDFWHRPDATISGDALSLADVNDPYGCGILYQDYWPRKQHLLACGRRSISGSIELALVKVHAEVCARDDVLGAGETVRHEAIERTTLAMLDHLDHQGHFTFNWLEADSVFRLSSMRPVPRALFRTLRKAGFDSFAAARPGAHIAPAGLKFTVDIHYSSYQNLAA